MAIRRIHDDQAQAQAENRSLRDLVAELANEITTLFRQEIALARAETSAKVSQARSGATMMVVGSMLAFVGLFVLLMSAVYALSEFMHPGWAALIVGGVAVLIGLLVLQSGRSNLKARNLLPERTAESIKRDADVATRRMQ